MAGAMRDLEEKAKEKEQQAREERGRMAARTWWGTPASTTTRAWVASGGAMATPNPTPFLTPAPPGPQRVPYTRPSLHPLQSQGDTTVFSVRAEDLTVGVGQMD